MLKILKVLSSYKRTGRGQLLHFILKRDSRVFYKKNYYTGKQGYPDCNRNPESYRIPLRVFVEYVLRHNAVCFYLINSVKVSSTFLQNQALPPYFGQHALRNGKQLIKGDQGSGHRAQGTGHRAQGTGHRAQGTGLRAQGTGLRAQGAGLGAQGTGRRAQGAGHRAFAPLCHYAVTPSHHTQTACRRALYKAGRRKPRDEPRPSPCRLREP